MVSNIGSDWPGNRSDESLRAGLATGRVRAGVAVLVGLFFLAWAYMDGISAYSRLPDRIPTHFGPGGAADGWAGKGVFPVFGLLMMGAALLVVMAFVSRLGARWYNFPGKERVLKLPPAQQAYVIAPMQELIAWLGAAMAVMLSVASRQTWAVALGERPGISVWVMLLPAAVGIVGAGLTIISARARLRALEEST